MNGAGQAWVDYIAQQILSKMASYPGLDGAFLDNVKPTPSYIANLPSIDANNDGVADSATGWSAGEQALHTKVRAAGVLVTTVGNGWLYSGSDGRQIESIPYFDDPYSYTPAFLANSIFPSYLQMTGTPGAFAPTGRYVAKPVTLLSADTRNTGTVSLQTMRFDLGLALLGNGYYAYDYGSHIHGNPWWYDEYDNGAGSSLASAVSASQTTLTLATGTGSRFSVGQTIYVPNDAINTGDPKNDEAMTISGISGDVLTVTRGVGNGGVGYAHMALAKVFTLAQLAAGLGWLGQPIGNPVTLLSLSAVSPALQNTDFDTWSGTAFANWTFSVNSMGTAAGSITQDTSAGGAPGSGGGTNAAKITVTTAEPGNKWHIRLYQSANTFQNGHTYTLTFAAKTDQTNGFDLQVTLELSDGTVRAKQDFILGTTWQQYTLTVTAQTTDSTAIRANFNFAAQTGTVWIDAVTLQEGDPNLWKRDYEHGTVIVNATATSQTYNLPRGNTYTKINGTQDHTTNSGAVVTSVTIAAFDAILLNRS